MQAFACQVHYKSIDPFLFKSCDLYYRCEQFLKVLKLRGIVRYEA
jgi:hypothetical protein